jgi:hypothetical protein
VGLNQVEGKPPIHLGQGGGLFVATPALGDPPNYVINCIFWDNFDANDLDGIDGSQIYDPVYVDDQPGLLDVTYSIIMDGQCDDQVVYYGTENTDDPPLFLSATESDFRLSVDSPALNTGFHDTSSNPFPYADMFDVDIDSDITEPAPGIDHGERIMGTKVDRGAFEFRCAADMTGPNGPGNPDGNVDSLDFLLMISQWGTPCVGSCEADITGPTAFVPDGNVESLDYLLVIAQYGNPGNCANQVSPDDPCETPGPSAPSSGPMSSPTGGPAVVLTTAEWMALMDAITSASPSEQLDGICWLEHYIMDCGAGCSFDACGPDPLAKH